MRDLATEEVMKVKNWFFIESSPIAVVILHKNPENYSKSTSLQTITARKPLSTVWKIRQLENIIVCVLKYANPLTQAHTSNSFMGILLNILLNIAKFWEVGEVYVRSYIFMCPNSAAVINFYGSFYFIFSLPAQHIFDNWPPNLAPVCSIDALLHA